MVESAMNLKLCRIVLAGLLCSLGVSCTTAYDAYGYPQQVVDPGVAIAGAAAVGLLAYGLSNSNDHHHRYYNGGHSQGHYYGGYGGGEYCRPAYYRSYCDDY